MQANPAANLLTKLSSIFTKPFISSSFLTSHLSPRCQAAILRPLWCKFSASARSEEIVVEDRGFQGLRTNNEYHRLLPCPPTLGAPRIEHLVVLEGGCVSQCINKTLDLPLSYVTDLIRFGAVHCALVCPKSPPTATPEQIEIYKRFTTPYVLRKRPFIKGKSLFEAQQTFRISHVDEHVESGTYLRVHVHRKRFPRCYEIEWRLRIIAVTDSYVVLDKPAGTSMFLHAMGCKRSKHDVEKPCRDHDNIGRDRDQNAVCRVQMSIYVAAATTPVATAMSLNCRIHFQPTRVSQPQQPCSRP